MGAGQSNHRGNGAVSNQQKARGLQSASPFATEECSAKSEGSNADSGVVGRVTPCAPQPFNDELLGKFSMHNQARSPWQRAGETSNIELRTLNIECPVPEGRSRIARRFNAGLRTEPSKSRRDGRNSRAEIFSIVPPGIGAIASNPGVKTPGYSRLFLRNKLQTARRHNLSPAAAGQSVKSQRKSIPRASHRGPAAPGLFAIHAVPNAGRDSALRCPRRLAAQRCVLNRAKGTPVPPATTRAVTSQRDVPTCASAPSLPNWRAIDWSLAHGASLELGCWSLELFTPAPLCP